MWGGTAQDLSRCGGFVEGGGHISPRLACGERSDRISDAIRVRGTFREQFVTVLAARAPHPDPLRASFARLDPARAGRGRSTQLYHSVTGLSEMSQSLPLNTEM